MIKPRFFWFGEQQTKYDYNSTPAILINSRPNKKKYGFTKTAHAPLEVFVLNTFIVNKLKVLGKLWVQPIRSDNYIIL